MAALSDFDLGLSRIAAGAPVGIAGGVARRSDRGLGVTAERWARPEAMESVDAVIAGSLKVLEPNSAAIALYDQLGFERTRMLEVWSLMPIRAVFAEPAVERGGRVDSGEPPQPGAVAARRSLANVAEVEAMVVPDRGAALFRVAGAWRSSSSPPAMRAPRRVARRCGRRASGS